MNDERKRSISSTPQLTPEDISGRTFSSSFRGIAEAEVKTFLQKVANEFAEGRRRVAELEAALEQAEVAASQPRRFTDEELLDQLGEETSRLLHTARDAARDIRAKAEDSAARMLAEAQESSHTMRAEAEGILEVRTGEAEAAAAEILDQARRDAEEIRATAERAAEALRMQTDAEVATIRADASRAAEIEVDDARRNARDTLDHARELREKVLADLSHRRTLLTEQIAELRNGREKLLEAYRVVKRSFLDATEALAQVEGRAATDRPDPVDPEVLAAAMRGEAQVGAADDTAADLADDVEPEEPLAPDAPQGPDEFGGDPDPSAAGEPDADSPDDGDGGPLPDAGDLFARIRAEREAVVEPEIATPPDIGSEPDDPTRVESSTAIATSTDDLAEIDVIPDEHDDPTTPAGWASMSVARIVDGALRPAKRTAQDEQNAVLDALRRQKGRPDAESALPARPDQADAWVSALAGSIAEAYAAGSSRFGGGAGTLAVELAIELTTAVLDPVRARFAQAIDESDDANEAIERLNARAREFRTQQLERSLGDLLAGVYARGVYDAAPDGATLQWVLAEAGCSADCADNVLEPTVKGSAFPTGHRHPPAHIGCRCSLTTAFVESSP
jgi:DivIVA domain-containing protein